MSADNRPLRAVPPGLWVLLALCIGAQLALKLTQTGGAPPAAELPPPPRVEALRLAAFGEREAVARIGMLWLQTVDFSAGHAVPYRALDYRRLVGWLRAILELDPRSEYPLFAAARVYAEVPDAERARIALEFVYEAFLEAPGRRWPWLAHAALLAKHRLKDLPLARRYAAAVARHAAGPEVPLWAKQMEIFILEDMNELEAAKVMLGGLLESGQIRDPAEARFLAQRLEELAARLAQKKVK
ncbi:MAG: hypothetical protein ACT4P4_11505 [Betaproteobacteria bacterium]